MSELIAKIVIPVESRTKKTHNQIAYINGRPVVLPSKQHLAYKKASSPYFKKYALHIDHPVNIKFLFYMKTHRKCDLVAHIQSNLDIMTEYGVIDDDNFTIASGYDGSRVLYDKENPRVEITITEMADEL